jgi:dual specificity MAP kinase phosphatase
MLHALGITHVVSVGECALVPPQANCSQAAEYRFSYGGKVLGAGPGSLWIEEREGRIKVLDIKVAIGILNPWSPMLTSPRASQMTELTA